MAYSEELAERVREVIAARSEVTERKMFGGVAWMVGGNMACGVMGDDLLVRLDREDAERALREPDVASMEFTGRRMRGFVRVEPPATADPSDLGRWVDTGADFAAALPAK